MSCGYRPPSSLYKNVGSKRWGCLESELVLQHFYWDVKEVLTLSENDSSRQHEILQDGDLADDSEDSLISQVVLKT